ncbi:MAG: orotidine-5'-phosphate decarboxylase [Patescibacteria group bacterium]
MNFIHGLQTISLKNKSLVCVGLDSDMKRIPDCILSDAHPQFAFNKAIIDATHDLVCAYKLNSAFYEAQGAKGIQELKMTCDYLREKYPNIPIILDAKRGDIGSTNHGYEVFAFDYLGVDAITLHPYLGREALQPFLDRKDKGCIILCKTSNSGSGEFQDLTVDDKPMYQIVAERVFKDWNTNANCMLVVGATYPEELMAVRQIVGDMTLLIPGVGTQGADIEKTVRAGVNSKGAGMIINSSRHIIFAGHNGDFAQKAREEAERVRNAINTYRTV